MRSVPLSENTDAHTTSQTDDIAEEIGVGMIAPTDRGEIGKRASVGRVVRVPLQPAQPVFFVTLRATHRSSPCTALGPTMVIRRMCPHLFRLLRGILGACHLEEDQQQLDKGL